MSKTSAAHLLTDLNERFGGGLPTSQQQDLLLQLDNHIHELGEDEPIDPSFLDALELYLAEQETEHPQAAEVIRQLLETLKNIGI